ncbi:hypothetical protein DQW50_05150 [Halorubrum sp. 48-1-W]|uniref:hypothetical protein n=1 Tax=Halorubrum sp. 48-1-W TaxID=2249761 RepID=UPI000DCB5789|nr:hypothetical protein [Halorubrum sp. 48-1-W]RAW46166.1 hypothetical protein DQW50_05150 [Halorubrum sp. 48-1-W]
MSPTRRGYLWGVCGPASLAGLAGCAVPAPTASNRDDGDGDGPPDGNGTDSGGTRPPGTGGPGVTVVSVDGDLELPIDPTVDVVREAATSESPPRLRTTLTNTGDDRVRIGEGRAVHFEYVTDDSGLLLLLPPADWYPAEPDCWRLTEGIAVTEEYRTFEVDAGASSSRVVDLYATPEADGCLPVGEFRFETTVAVVSSDAESLSSGRWGFTVLLE